MTPHPHAHSRATSSGNPSIPSAPRPALTSHAFVDLLPQYAAEQPLAVGTRLELAVVDVLVKICAESLNRRGCTGGEISIAALIDERYGEHIGALVGDLVAHLAGEGEEAGACTSLAGAADPIFDKLRRVYPNWIGDEEAVRAALQRVKATPGFSPAVFFAGVERWLASAQWADPKYIPGPLKFLDLQGQRWLAMPARSGKSPIVSDLQRQWLEAEGQRRAGAKQAEWRYRPRPENEGATIEEQYAGIAAQCQARGEPVPNIVAGYLAECDRLRRRQARAVVAHPEEVMALRREAEQRLAQSDPKVLAQLKQTGLSICPACGGSGFETRKESA